VAEARRLYPELAVEVENYGNDLDSLTLILQCDSPEISLTDSIFVAGQLARLGSADNKAAPFAFHLAGDVTPQLVNFQLILLDNSDTLSTEIIRVKVGYAGVLLVDDDGGSEENLIWESALDSRGLFYEVFEGLFLIVHLIFFGINFGVKGVSEHFTSFLSLFLLFGFLLAYHSKRFLACAF